MVFPTTPLPLHSGCLGTLRRRIKGEPWEGGSIERGGSKGNP